MKTLFLILTISASIQMLSQTLSPELVASSGAYKDTLGINLSWSLGEAVIATFKRDENMLTQGFHQWRYVVTTMVNEPSVDYEIKVYPNPVTDLLHISIEKGQKLTDKHFYLIDLKGKRLKEGKFVKNIENLDLSSLPVATYILYIRENNKTLKTFRIVKERM